LDAAGDSTLILLMVLAAVNTASGIYKDGPEHGWIDGVAIFVAVFIIIAITSGNNYSKEK